LLRSQLDPDHLRSTLPELHPNPGRKTERLGQVEPQAAHLIGIPSVIEHELETFVRDVLGDAGDEVAGVKHFKIALDLGVHPRAVNDRAPGGVGLHFLDREVSGRQPDG